MICEAQILFNTTYQKEKVKKHSHVTTVIRYVWYVLEYESFIQVQISDDVFQHVCMLQLETCN